jgi:hypothetical protein
MENFDIFSVSFFTLILILYFMGVIYYELGYEIMVTPLHWVIVLMVGCIALCVYRVFTIKKARGMD